MVKDFGLPRLSFWNQRFVKNIENVPTHLFQFGLNLLTIFANLGYVLLIVLCLLLLLDTGDDTPRGASCTDHVFVSNGQQIAFVNGKFSAELIKLLIYTVEEA
jgi:hypothetical protein